MTNYKERTYQSLKFMHATKKSEEKHVSSKQKNLSSVNNIHLNYAKQMRVYPL